ncbi:hypothetical protein BJY52DRAFT_205544 [Lactarius psammicola]|nr:hypothetical protein BJY52DRAFT_205544 [Lactarius psammicola]
MCPRALCSVKPITPIQILRIDPLHLSWRRQDPPSRERRDRHHASAGEGGQVTIGPRCGLGRFDSRRGAVLCCNCNRGTPEGLRDHRFVSLHVPRVCRSPGSSPTLCPSFVRAPAWLIALVNPSRHFPGSTRSVFLLIFPLLSVRPEPIRVNPFDGEPVPFGSGSTKSAVEAPRGRGGEEKPRRMGNMFHWNDGRAPCAMSRDQRTAIPGWTISAQRNLELLVLLLTVG